MNYQALHTRIRGMEGTYYRLNEVGVEAHFYAANGFVVGAYHAFLSELSSTYQLTSLEMRPCWEGIGPAKKQMRWEVYAEDLAAFLKQAYDHPIVGIGHSQGATCTLMAAAKYPSLFKEVILIEPASFTPELAMIAPWVPYFFKKTREPVKSTLRKPAIWASKAAYFAACRATRAYKRIPDQVLQHVVDHGLRSTEDGQCRLVISPEWEAANYTMPPTLISALKQVKIPIRVIAGKPSIFFEEKLRKRWEKNAGNNYAFRVNSQFGHLFPLESPQICAEMVRKDS